MDEQLAMQRWYAAYNKTMECARQTANLNGIERMKAYWRCRAKPAPVAGAV